MLLSANSGSDAVEIIIATNNFNQNTNLITVEQQRSNKTAT